ncbi:hypothetical protein [Microbulbifer rhizosphaerae]|uniref:Negative regulator of sigma E activity n=1 Tax=Microbulbifer rhizosphaerae TaxID=1562603 RepID=A0A7W4Z9R3_9GAMM|nr:hypothetical protein [Microbulbifer rhizosphaerae]MBB3060509.1 negative regulator of sigma E activity [Microbulbifer rhizosphaerae]
MNSSNENKLSDEILSAFLDAELPQVEMERVRQRLCDDETLSDRLAELAGVDQLLAVTYSSIDERPLPEAVTAMLAEESPPRPAQVIQFPLWRRAHEQLQRHAGLAAAVTLAIGLGAGWLLPDQRQSADNAWQAVATTLEHAPSGKTQELADGRQLTPRLTFISRQGDYCRQYQVVSGTRGSENIACRSGDGEWQLTASVQQDAIQEPGTYRTASGGSLLDSALDAMVATDIDPGTEAKIIAEDWNKTPARPSAQ